MTQPNLHGSEPAVMSSLFEAQQPRRVLEWGPGGSTLTWAPKYESIVEWVAVEHQERYYKGLLERVDAKVTLKLLPFPQYWEDQLDAGPFDLIYVDGRERAKCLEVASRILAEKGVVVLHDSCRVRYKPAWDFFRHSATLFPGLKDSTHRGLTVFWQDGDVETDAWIWEHAQSPHQFY